MKQTIRGVVGLSCAALALLLVFSGSAWAQDPYADEVVEFVRVNGIQFNTYGDNNDDGSDILGPPNIEDGSCVIQSGDPSGCWTSPGYIPGVWNVELNQHVYDEFGQLDARYCNASPIEPRCPQAGYLTVRFTDNRCNFDPDGGPSLFVWEVGGKTEGFLVEVFNGDTKVAEAYSAPKTQTNGDVPITFDVTSGYFDTVRLTPTDNGGGDPLAPNTSGPDFDAVHCINSAPPTTECVVDLIADGGSEDTAVDVGDVTVTEDGDGWNVTYATTGDWVITELHLDLVCDAGDFPMTKSGNPKVGRFCYAAYPDPAVQEYTFEDVSTEDCENGSCDCTLFAAHAVVVDEGDCWLEQVGVDPSGNPIYEEVCREETAWGYGEPFPGKNWATYFECGDCQ